MLVNTVLGLLLVWREVIMAQYFNRDCHLPTSRGTYLASALDHRGCEAGSP
jgi:hypothetical protein